MPSLNEAAALVDALHPAVEWFKIGSELFTAAGPDAVEIVRRRGRRVFLDLKYHDIPNTVGRAVSAAAALGIDMLTVHAAGGANMLHAAVEAARGSASRTQDPGRRTLVLGVTLLTSDADPGAAAIVLERARLAASAGLDGVVASAREAAAIKAACGRTFVVVTPGIRPPHGDHQDQQRTATLREALAAGCDYLVVGRPITRAGDPRLAAEGILREIEEHHVSADT